MTIDHEQQSPRQPATRNPPRSIMILGCLFVAWLIGQFARDRVWLTGVLFYVPSVAVAAVCLASIPLYLWRQHRRCAIAAAVMMSAPLAVVLFVENHWVRPPAATGSGVPLRVVHWNVGFALFGWPGVQRELDRTGADLYVLSEPPRWLNVQDLAARLGPEYTAVSLRPAGASLSPMVAFARGELTNVKPRVVNQRLKVFSMTWKSRQGPIEVFAVDLASNPMLARDPALQELKGLMLEHQPDLVVGDFNAPRRSRALTPPPTGFVHAYDVAGCGWSATWPLPCPLLAIDQCLLGTRIGAVRYELVSKLSSDHREQVLDFFVTSRPQ